MSPERAPTRIVILGGGFAGLALAQRLEKIVRKDEVDVTLVSRDNYALFTPMLPEVSAGDLEPRHIVSPLRALLRHTKLMLAEVTAIDFEEKTLDVRFVLDRSAQQLRYDHLVLATGSVTATFGIPGVGEHTFPFKRLEDADALRNHIVSTLELADVESDPSKRRTLLTYAIVGGGYTGVEVAGELVDFFHSVLGYYRTIERNEIQIALIEGGPRLLPDLLPKMGVYCTEFLSRRRVRVMLGAPVASVDSGGVAFKDGRRVDAATVVWSAGVRPSPFIAGLPLPHARNGGIMAQADMSVEGHPGVWALGDCAWIPAPEGGYYPSTAQHALREGPALAENILRVLRGQPTRPFKWKALGTMASLGGRRGVVGFPNGFVLTGFLAWWLWRTYYLVRIPGWYRKVRVGFDWFIGLIFPRDIAELRVDTERARSDARRDAGRA
ncbi:MAG: NAD(P)/FAD-dependent oxidoreductase [Candidatus Eremiobacteraeota bacterium]|nr:NAD(P)/FAD-dependent oxidoreductase [Candidatus Eremiobacteraeota bacterium]